MVERPAGHFVGVRLTADYDSIAEAVAAARRSLLARQFEIQSIVNPDQQLCVTLPQEQEAAEDQVTTYFGFTVASSGTPPSGMFAIELPSGRYAQFDWKGAFDSDEFGNFYPSIFAWFQQQVNVAPSTASPWIELYGEHNDWDDSSNPNNTLTVQMPLGGAGSAAPGG